MNLGGETEKLGVGGRSCSDVVLVLMSNVLKRWIIKQKC